MVANCLTVRWLRPILACFAFAGLAFLGGCGGGSGAPNNPYTPVPPTPSVPAILPASSVVYSNTPATLTISGGVAPYFVTSSNAAILPVAQINTTGTIVLLPANVVLDTAVVIQATDSVGQTANATVTVKAAPIFNTLTITPSSAACGSNAICSGQTATAKVTVLAPGGAGIPNRQVRFDVVAGAYSIKSSDPANPLVSTLTVVSDQFGVALVILQATAGVPTQPAVLRVTELISGDQETAQFTIVQTINGSAVLSVVPSDITFTGADTTQCTTNFRGDSYIYGGTPPYQVNATTAGVLLANVPVLTAGGFFTAITNPPPCVNPEIFTIVDATGLQTTATLHNLVGTTPPPPPPPSPLAVAPSPQSGTCTGSATFTFVVTGGTPGYNVAASSGSIVVQPNASGLFTVQPPLLPPLTVVSVVTVDSGSPQQSTNAKINCT